MTNDDVEDPDVFVAWMKQRGVKNPVAARFEKVCVLGRTVHLSEVSPQDGDIIMRAGSLGIYVLGDGASWAEAGERMRGVLDLEHEPSFHGDVT